MNQRKFRLKKLRKSTCFCIGVAGAALGLLTGILMMAGMGMVQYGHTTLFIMYGAMLLMLGALEKGPKKRGRRLRLLGLFFMLLLANLRLPLLDWLEAPVLPLLALMYRGKGDIPFIAVLALFEAALAACRTLQLPPVSLGLWEYGLALALASIVRGAMLLRLQSRARTLPEGKGM